MNQAAPPPRSRLLDFLRLMRVSNVFTAVADVGMGFLFGHATLESWGPLLLLVAASALLYSAGMVLNDVFDVDLDRRQRPERPIPAGRVSLPTARMLGFGLLLAGLVCGWAAGLTAGAAAPAWRSGVVATGLAACILAYDGAVKRTPLGPLTMGLCRLLNVLLGMSVAAAFDASGSILGYGPQHLAAAAGIGVYVTGVTWLARSEAGRSRRGQLVLATAVMAAGIVLLGFVHRLLLKYDPAPLALDEPMWWMLLAMLAVTIIRRCGMAIAGPGPQRVQEAVRHGIWSLIMLDAAVVLLLRDMYALGIIALLIPTAILGKWVAST